MTLGAPVCPLDCPCEARTGRKLPVLRGNMNETKRAELKRHLQQACTTLKGYQEDWHRSSTAAPAMIVIANIVRMTAELVLDEPEPTPDLPDVDEPGISALERGSRRAIHALFSPNRPVRPRAEAARELMHAVDDISKDLLLKAEHEARVAAETELAALREREKERAQLEAILARRSVLDGLSLVQKVQLCVDVAKQSDALAAALSRIRRRFTENADEKPGYTGDWVIEGRGAREDARAALNAAGREVT